MNLPSLPESSGARRTRTSPRSQRWLSVDKEPSEAGNEVGPAVALTRVHPLDNKVPAGHIYQTVVGVKPSGFLVG